MTNTIMDTGNLAEILELGPDDEIANMSATHEATDKPLEFHVQMHGHTFRDMEQLIVNAAAQQLVGGYGGANAMRKQIEAKTIEHVTQQANVVLSKVSAEIIDQPMMPKYTGSKDEPVTMREFIGLTGRAYLAEPVDSSGNPSTSSSWGGGEKRPRIQHIVEKVMFGKFKGEIEAATNAAIAEIRNEIKVRHDAFLSAEKARLREAISKLTA